MTVRAKKFEHILDPSSVLELGYAAHVVDDPLAAGTQARLLAAKLMADLMAMRCGNPDDEAYLFRARAIILSLGRGITRRKLAYRADIDAAEAYRAAEISRIDSQRGEAFWTTLTWRTLVAGGIGFALMESLLPFVHLHFEHSGSQVTMTGVAPSLLLGLVFAAGSKVAFSKMEDFKYRSIFQHYEWIRLQAVYRYETGKLKEFERNHGEIRRIWRDYTGRQPPRAVTFATVLADDIRTQEWLERERRREMAGIFAKLLTTLRNWRIKQETKLAQRTAADRTGDRPHPDGAVSAVGHL